MLSCLVMRYVILCCVIEGTFANKKGHLCQQRKNLNSTKMNDVKSTIFHKKSIHNNCHSTHRIKLKHKNFIDLQWFSCSKS